MRPSCLCVFSASFHSFVLWVNIYEFIRCLTKICLVETKWSCWITTKFHSFEGCSVLELRMTKPRALVFCMGTLKLQSQFAMLFMEKNYFSGIIESVSQTKQFIRICLLKLKIQQWELEETSMVVTKTLTWAGDVCTTFVMVKESIANNDGYLNMVRNNFNHSSILTSDRKLNTLFLVWKQSDQNDIDPSEIQNSEGALLPQKYHSGWQNWRQPNSEISLLP